jgi:hypothetical protein
MPDCLRVKKSTPSIVLYDKEAKRSTSGKIQHECQALVGARPAETMALEPERWIVVEMQLHREMVC